MNCKYCGCLITSKRLGAIICGERPCKNQGKSERAFARRQGADRVHAYVPRVGTQGNSFDPPEFEYLNAAPGITTDQLLSLRDDPALRKAVQESRRLRQEKLTQRIREVGLYD